MLYLAGLVALCGAAWTFGRAAGFSTLSVVTFLLLLTFRHRITKTAVNSLA